MNRQPPARDIDPAWAWQRYRPSDESPWDLRKVGHLYRRAAFGATLAELDSALAAGPDRAIDLLLRGGPDRPEFGQQSEAMTRTIRESNNGQQLSAWWLYRMLYTPHPLREKLTLFWHNHFATSNLKVQNAGYMLGQYELLRRHAQGSFRTLLLEMARDPAMMVWLDTVQSQRQMPNENYARELMELFSLGINNARHPDRRNYTEQDVREAARAFTGWRLKITGPCSAPRCTTAARKTCSAGAATGRPTTSPASVWSRSRPRISSPASCSAFWSAKPCRRRPSCWSRWRPPSAAATMTSARWWRRCCARIRFSPRAYRTRVKAPVEFGLGIVRALEGRIGTAALGQAMEGLGQHLFYPPTVAGWDGGRAWLNGQTLLSRQNLSLALTSTEDDRYGRRTDPAALARRHDRTTPERQVDFFVRLFLQGDVTAATRQRLLEYHRRARQSPAPVYWTPDDAADHRVRALCHLVLTLPEFQLE